MQHATIEHDGPEVSEHFDDAAQQHDSALLGMWAFLATEVLFFGGLFAAYTIYRHLHFDGFAAASKKLNVPLGAINTAVLLTSSLTMALAVRGAQLRKKSTVVWMLAVTAILGAAFIAIKGVEWTHDYHEGLIPGRHFEWEGDYRNDAQMFFLIYFMMTGLHGIHMIIGIGLVSLYVFWSARSKQVGRLETQVEVLGLYWHFVDLMWVFLYPLLYLIKVHA
jgi:cytochrome c oxidase subunit 3